MVYVAGDPQKVMSRHCGGAIMKVVLDVLTHTKTGC